MDGSSGSSEGSDGEATKKKNGTRDDAHPPLYGRFALETEVATVEAVLEGLCTGAFHEDSGFTEMDQIGLFSTGRCRQQLRIFVPFACLPD